MEKLNHKHFYNDNFIIFGHRGVPQLCKENTLDSFLKAIELNYTGIELDIMQTKDNQLIVHHDLNIIYGKKAIRIQELTLKQIKKANPEIPKLKTILRKIGHRTNINIEIKEQKGNAYSVVKETIKQLKAYNLVDNIIISSFSTKIIKYAKEEDDRFATAWIVGKKNLWFYLKWMFCLKNLKINAIHLKHKIINSKIIKQANKKKIKVLAYTVNDEKSLKKIKKLRVDGIFTDSPDILIASRLQPGQTNQLLK